MLRPVKSRKLWTICLALGLMHCTRADESTSDANSEDPIQESHPTPAPTGDAQKEPISFVEADDPTPVTGVNLTYENAKLRCDQRAVTGQPKTFDINCLAVEEVDLEREIVPYEIEPGLELDWQDPTEVQGSVEILSCQLAANQLRRTCRVRTETDLVELRFPLRLAKKDSTRTEEAFVLLPYAVGVTAGYVPWVGRRYSGTLQNPKPDTAHGLQGVADSPTAPWAKVHGVCVQGSGIPQLVINRQIYELQKNKLRIFAGGNNGNRRKRWGLDWTSPPSITCVDDGLIIDSETASPVLATRKGYVFDLETGIYAQGADRQIVYLSRTEDQWHLRQRDPDGKLLTLFSGKTDLPTDGTVKGPLLQISDKQFVVGATTRIFSLHTDGTTSHLAGSAVPMATPSDDGTLATDAWLGAITQIRITKEQELAFIDGANQLRQILSDNTLTTIAEGITDFDLAQDGSWLVVKEQQLLRLQDGEPANKLVGSDGEESPDGMSASWAFLKHITDIAYRIDGSLLILADRRLLTIQQDKFVVLNSFPSHLGHPSSVIEGPDGLIYLAWPSKKAIFRRLADGSLEAYAGIPMQMGDSGYGGPANEAMIKAPRDLYFNATGELFFWDHVFEGSYSNQAVRMVAGKIKKIDLDGNLQLVMSIERPIGQNDHMELVLSDGSTIKGEGINAVTYTYTLLPSADLLLVGAGHTSSLSEIDLTKKTIRTHLRKTKVDDFHLDYPFQPELLPEGDLLIAEAEFNVDFQKGKSHLYHYKRTEDTWTVASIMSNDRQDHRCGDGSLKGEVPEDKLDDAINHSLAMLCRGDSIRNVAVHGTCRETGGTIKFAIVQAFRLENSSEWKGAANVVEVQQPCR